MSWSGGSYTKGNAGTGGWTGDASLGIGIEAGRHDTQDDDFATGINQCLNKDGSNSCTGDLNLGGFKPVNLAAGTAAAPAICAGGDVNTGIFSPAADQIGIATNGTEKVRVNDTGRIGVGTTAPGFTVDIQTTTSNIVSHRFSADTSPPQIVFRKSRSGTVGTNTIVQNGDALGGVYFQGANGTSYTDAAGILGEVDGTPGASNDMPGRLRFFTTPDGSGATTERMRISSNGHVSIGTTSTGSMLFIQNNQSNSIPCISIQSNVAGDLGTSAFNIVKKDNDATTSQVMMRFLMNGAAAGQGQINANGAFQVAFGSYSDERLKENIVDLPSQLANIFALRPVEFDYKDGFGHQIGFIAQEVKEIYPDLVGDGQDGFLTLSGLGKNEARMIKAFQEFAQLTQAKVEALEARIAALEA